MQETLPDRREAVCDQVTYHAVTRYVQRILGVSIDRSFPTPRATAQAHCRAVGLTIRQVKTIIWTPGVQLASRNGFRNVGTSDFRAAINEFGTVVTILEPRSKDRSKLKILSPRELAADSHRFQRRVRHKSKTHRPKKED